MKLNKWLYGAAALAMLAACSDKDIAPDSGGVENGKFEAQEGLGYIGIALQLPQQPSTRADDHSNDRFEDGIAAEYNVSNAALLLFWGATNGKEADAQFVGAYKISPDEKFDMPNGDNITTSFQNVATLNKKFKASEGQLWGLAIVNYDSNVFKIGGGDNVGDSEYGTLTVVQSQTSVDAEGKLIITDTSTPIPIKKTGADGMKFSDFRELITARKLYNKNTDGLNIFMTNSPLCDDNGETDAPDDGYKIQTLSKLDADKIFENEQDARLYPSGCIFVERAVAKVTISNFPQDASLTYQPLQQGVDGTVTAGEKQTVTLKVTSVECIIDNEETDSYFVRFAKKGKLINPEDDDDDIWTMVNQNKYRFVGNASMNDKTDPSYDSNSDNHNWFRTYWCQDPHYSDNKIFNDQANSGTYTTVYNGTTLDKNVAFYPRENTFALENQNYRNTTRVVFRVQYQWTVNGKTANVYCKAGDPSVIYMSDDAKKLLMESFVTSNVIHDYVLKVIDINKAKDIEGMVKVENGVTQITYGTNDFNLAYKTVETATDGKLYQITGVSLKGNLANALKDEYKLDDQIDTSVSELESAMAHANSTVKIRSFYDENSDDNSNVCYYAVNIQHFGDTYCKMPANYTGITTAQVYEFVDTPSSKSKAKYLGRWGLVRNNWYDLSIDKIWNMGYASVPDAQVDTSDDNNQELYYLSARVHILSWARRTQKHEF